VHDARRRVVRWRPASGVLAALGWLLGLAGCDKAPLGQAGERVDESVEDMNSEAGDMKDDLTGRTCSSSTHPAGGSGSPCYASEPNQKDVSLARNSPCGM
jgi:hypothetical protein